MGRTVAEPGLPRGISRRETAEGPRLQVAFSYQGQQCRELLPPAKITKAYVEYATGLRAEIKRNIDDGTFNYAAYFPDSKAVDKFGPTKKWVLLGDLLRKQKATYEAQAANDNLSSSTLLGYVKIIDNVLIPRFDKVSIADLTPAILRPWIGGMGITGKSVRNILTPLRSVLEDAVNDELIPFNPLDRIALKKLIKQTEAKSDYEVDPFDGDEIAAMLKAARIDERLMVQFWFQSGLRPGELIALAWPKIDWIHDRARIDSNAITGMVEGKIRQVFTTPKTAAGVRDVDLNTMAMDALRAQKAVSFMGGGLIWMNPRTGEPWEHEAQIRKTLWEPLCRRAGVRYRNPYQARHTFASTRLTDGANPYYIADQLGHEDVQMVFKIYGKFISKNYQKAGRFTRDSHEADAAPKLEAASD